MSDTVLGVSHRALNDPDTVDTGMSSYSAVRSGEGVILDSSRMLVV